MTRTLMCVAAVLFVMLVLAVKECGEWLDEDAMAAVEPDPRTMKPCVGRKPVREHGRKYVWYCGDSGEQVARAASSVAQLDAGTTKGRAKVGAACGRTGTQGH